MFDLESAESCQNIVFSNFYGPWSEKMVKHTQVQKNESILDIGCGTGEAARYAAKLSGANGSVYGVDCEAKLLLKAQKLDPQSSVKWLETELSNLPFVDEEFDAVIGSQIYQFLFNRDLALRECHRVLKPGGRMVLNIFSRQELCPGHNALIKGLETCNVDATNLKQFFAQSDPIAIGDCIAAYGFKDVSVVRKTLETKFLSPRFFVETFANSDPFIESDFQKLKNDNLETVIEYVTKELQSNAENEGVRILTTANFVFGRRR